MRQRWWKVPARSGATVLPERQSLIDRFLDAAGDSGGLGTEQLSLGQWLSGMLTLAAECGARMTLRAQGADAEEAIAKLAAVIEGFEVDD